MASPAHYWNEARPCQQCPYASDNKLRGKVERVLYVRFPLQFWLQRCRSFASESSKRAAASACKYVLPAFGNELAHFKFEMKRDYEQARQWIAPTLSRSVASRRNKGFASTFRPRQRGERRERACSKLARGHGTATRTLNKSRRRQHALPGIVEQSCAISAFTTVYITVLFLVWYEWNASTLTALSSIQQRPRHIMCQILIAAPSVRKHNAEHRAHCIWKRRCVLALCCLWFIFDDGGRRNRATKPSPIPRGLHLCASPPPVVPQHFWGPLSQAGHVVGELLEVPMQVWSLHFKAKTLPDELIFGRHRSSFN